MKEHLSGSHIDVRQCPNVPEEVKLEMGNYLKMKESKKSKKQQDFEEIVASGSYCGASSNASASIDIEKMRVRGPMDRFVARDGDENAEATQQQVMPQNRK